MEFLQDRLNKLSWDQMQELVAGLLRAMGYKTRISPPGPDCGKDIIAFPDALGFVSPRIVTEVKHRKGTMGAPDVRAFAGGLRNHDNGDVARISWLAWFSCRRKSPDLAAFGHAVSAR
jgi:restriction system protein